MNPGCLLALLRRRPHRHVGVWCAHVGCPFVGPSVRGGLLAGR